MLWLATECDEALEAGDRIAVMYRGRLGEPVQRDRCDPVDLQMAMAGIETAAAR